MKTTSVLTRLFSSLAFIFLLATANTQIFTIVCPDDASATCEDDFSDLSNYGDAYIQLGKGNIPLADPVEVIDLDQCDVGTISRTWTTMYSKVVYSCTQFITVVSTGGDVQNIVWPEDIEFTECNPATDPEDLPTENSYPTYWSPPCSAVGVSHSDQLYNLGTSCSKIVRTWEIINWCQYDGSESGPGYFTFKQHIKINNEEAPEYTCPEDVVGKAHNCWSGEIISPPLVIPNSSCGQPYEISNNSQYALENGADLSGIYPIGTTTVQYLIEYGCGTREFCYVDVIVEDVSVPVPYCLATIHTALMPVDTDEDGEIDNGMVEIWAKDFDHNSYDICGNDFEVSFSPDELVMAQTFTCDDVGENRINIYYISENGNYSYCTVTLDIQNNSDIPNCEPMLVEDDEVTRIAGVVKNVFGDEEEAIVIECQSNYIDTLITENIDTTSTMVVIDSFLNASGNWVFQLEEILEFHSSYDTLITEYEEMHHGLTDELGAYDFDSVTMYIDYALKGICPENDMDLIDQCDLNILVDHILGDQLIEDPALLFAADLDENGRVDFDDLKALMFYLGGVAPDLPYQNAYYIFPTTVENDFYTAESSILYTDLDTSMTQSNFTYILKGNLCNHPFSSHEKQDPMNIFTTIGQRLPLNLRKDIEAEMPTVFTEPAEFAFYPNPFSSSFTISINNPKAQVIEIEVFNSQGQKVYRRSAFIDKGFHTLDNDLESLAPGAYFYQVTAGGSEFHGKAIKK